MLDLFGWEGAQQCISSGESSWVPREVIFVGYEVWLVSLGLGALVSGSDDVP